MISPIYLVSSFYSHSPPPITLSLLPALVSFSFFLRFFQLTFTTAIGKLGFQRDNKCYVHENWLYIYVDRSFSSFRRFSRILSVVLFDRNAKNLKALLDIKRLGTFLFALKRNQRISRSSDKEISNVYFSRIFFKIGIPKLLECRYLLQHSGSSLASSCSCSIVSRVQKYRLRNS